MNSSESASEAEIQAGERVTVRLPPEQVAKLERAVEVGQFPNRSEAIRAAIDALSVRDENGHRSRDHSRR